MGQRLQLRVLVPRICKLAGTFAGGGGAGPAGVPKTNLLAHSPVLLSFAFNVQSTVGTVQTGAIVLRVYSSTDPTGVGAVQRTTAELTGTTATIAATNTTVTSTGQFRGHRPRLS